MRTSSRFVAILMALALAAPAVAQVKSYQEITYPPLPAFNIPKPQVVTLKNGLTVYMLQDRELPLVQISARIRTGSNYEPADKTGLARLMAAVQRTGGTARMSGDAIDDFLAVRAASIETGMGGDSAFANMDCLKGDVPEVLRVFADILRNPTFADEKLQIAKVQARTAIARRNDNVNAITARELQRLVYGEDSPLARNEEYATIAAITRDDLLAFHRTYYHPNNVYLGVVGDFEPRAMLRLLEQVFGDWPRGPRFAEPPAAYRKAPRPGVFYIEKKDVTQANIAMGHLGIEMANPDFFAVQVLNEVLGGSFASRMFSNIRSKKGLAYNVYGAVGAGYTTPGILRAGMQTKLEKMGEAVEALQEELRGIIANPPTPEELARAKESILNSFVFNYDSSAKILRQQMLYAYYGLPANFLETYRANIEKVTAADVARVAKAYVRPDQLSLLVVGDASKFDRPLSTFGPVTTVDITIPPPPDTTAKVEKTERAADAGRALLARAARALGGADAAKVRAISSSATMTVSMGGQSMSMKRSGLIVFPNRVRQVVSTPMGEQVVVIDGSSGFMAMGGQVRPLPASMVEQQQSELKRDLRVLVWSHADPEMEAVAGGEDRVDGQPCTILQVTYKGAASQLCVAANGTVLRQSYQGTNPLTGAPGQVELRMSDYRELDGRQVPFRQVMLVDGQEVMTSTLESWQVNPPVDEALFARPAA
ncbi:MAG: insulinase family protein [Acidobacteriota bacterium]|jgi:predicted Zn-dependent peptidase